MQITGKHAAQTSNHVYSIAPFVGTAAVTVGTVSVLYKTTLPYIFAAYVGLKIGAENYKPIEFSYAFVDITRTINSIPNPVYAAIIVGGLALIACSCVGLLRRDGKSSTGSDHDSNK